MSMLSGLIGSGGSKSKSYLTEQADWLKALLEQYGQASKEGPNVYQGTRVAPQTEAQKNLSNVGSFASALQPVATSPLYSSGETTLGNIVKGEIGAKPYTDEQIEQRWQTAYKPQYEKAYGEAIDKVRNEFGGNYWGSALGNELLDTGKEWAQDVGTAYSQYRGGMEDVNRQIQQQQVSNALSGINQIPSYSSYPTSENLSRISGLSQAYGLSSTEQQQQQNEINAAIQKYAEENQITDPQVLQTLMALIGQNMNTSTTTGPGILNSWAQGFGSDFMNAAMASI